MKRILVCGGRDFTDRDLVFATMDKVKGIFGDFELVHGGAKGADSFSDEWADSVGCSKKVFKPDWKMYKRAAGPIRNGQMLEYLRRGEEPLVIAFWDGKSKGTKDMITKAKKAGVKCNTVLYVA